SDATTSDATTSETSATTGGLCWEGWCPQAGTMDQATMCGAGSTGAICLDPVIKYGSTIGGVPVEHLNNNFDQWCSQLGFVSAINVEYGPRPCPEGGAVYWCADFDEPTPHWCDYKDGFWRSSTLDGADVCAQVPGVTLIECG